jgi:hypothetical protein
LSALLLVNVTVIQLWGWGETADIDGDNHSAACHMDSLTGFMLSVRC